MQHSAVHGSVVDGTKSALQHFVSYRKLIFFDSSEKFRGTLLTEICVTF